MLEEGVDAHHVEAHIGYHRQFVERVEAMWSHRSALMQHPETIAGFLTSWLGLHILGVDQSMSRQIEAIRAGKLLSLLMIDVDAFKQYNDLYGHPAGDECLREVAKAIRLSLLRASDCVARYGGEEIAVLLPDTDLAGAMFVAERMREAVQSLGLTHAGSKTAGVVTVSIGVACAVPDAAAACATLVRAADQALYRAKAAGRNRLDVALEAVAA